MFEHGKCLKKDLQSALDHYSYAAQEGLLDAQAAKGIILLSASLPSDHTYTEAAETLLIASRKGSAKGQSALAYLFMCDPTSLDLDKTEVEHFLSMAVQKGNSLAKGLDLWSRGARDAAQKELSNSRNSRDPLAASLLLLHSYSRRKKLDKQGYEFLRELCENGNPVALHLRAALYISEKDYKGAKLLFEQLAKKGDSRSLLCLGILYSGGYGVKRDDIKAVEYFRKAKGTEATDCLFYLAKSGRVSGPEADIYKEPSVTYGQIKAKIGKTLEGKGWAMSHLPD
jgi:TPR repeat protein